MSYRFFYFSSFFVALLVFLGFSSCEDSCKTTTQYVRYEYIYKTSQEIRDQVEVVAPRPVEQAGKIYLLDNAIFINEVGKGIHVFTHDQLCNPTPTAFIRIDGNYDLAGQGPYLYADNFVDLLVFDISNLSDITLEKRIESVFDQFYTVGGFTTEDVFLAGVEEIPVVEERTGDCRTNQAVMWDGGGFWLAEFADARSVAAFSPAAAQAVSTGTGGSLARFTISQNHLYTVDWNNLYAFDLNNPASPEKKSESELDWGVETIFPYKDMLFLGTQTGVLIYKISSPEQPNFLSEFQHAQACDPVVVQNDIAFVTLRSGLFCFNDLNQLDVIDVKNPAQPKLLHTFPMDNPHGLGVLNDHLLLCEGAGGLKLFNIEDLSTIDQHLIDEVEGLHALDVIPTGNLAYVLAQDGLYLYNYDDQGLTHCSTIPIQ